MKDIVLQCDHPTCKVYSSRFVQDNGSGGEGMMGNIRQEGGDECEAQGSTSLSFSYLNRLIQTFRVKVGKICDPEGQEGNKYGRNTKDNGYDDLW